MIMALDDYADTIWMSSLGLLVIKAKLCKYLFFWATELINCCNASDSNTRSLFQNSFFSFAISTSPKLRDIEEPAVHNSALEGATSSLGVIEKIPEPKQQEMCSKKCARAATHEPWGRVGNRHAGSTITGKRQSCSDDTVGGRGPSHPLLIEVREAGLWLNISARKALKMKDRTPFTDRSVDFTVLWHVIKLWYLYLAVQPCCTLTIWPDGYFYRLLMDG